jgi:hypothetical protein
MIIERFIIAKVTESHFHPSQIIAGKALALTANII